MCKWAMAMACPLCSCTVETCSWSSSSASPPQGRRAGGRNRAFLWIDNAVSHHASSSFRSVPPTLSHSITTFDDRTALAQRYASALCRTEVVHGLDAITTADKETELPRRPLVSAIFPAVEESELPCRLREATASASPTEDENARCLFAGPMHANGFTESCSESSGNGMDLGFPEASISISRGRKLARRRHRKSRRKGTDSSVNSTRFSSEQGFLQVLSTLESRGSPPDVLSDHVLDLSDSNSAPDSSNKMVDFFLWIKRHASKPSSNAIATYAKAFTVLGKRQDWDLIDRMLREHIPHTHAVFNLLFQTCFRLDSPEWADKWLHYMFTMNIQPNRGTFGLLMPLYLKHGKLKEAEFAYTFMADAGFQCSRASLNMMKLYSDARQFEKAKQIFNRIQEIFPNPRMEFFLLLLNAYVEESDVNGAEEIMRYMLESSGGAKVHVTAYNLMIRVNGKMGHFYSARAWFHQIEKDGLQPNAASFRSILGACGRSAKFDEALMYYGRMKTCGFPPSLINFNTLIHLHRKVDNNGRIFSILADMKHAFCTPDSTTLHSLLKVYERYGRLDCLPEALGHLRDAGWVPTSKCYGLLVRTYMRSNMVKPALEAFDNLCLLTEVEEILSHNLICMCKSRGCYDEAIHVFNKIRNPSLKTVCTMIDTYGLMGEVEQAEALFESLKTSGMVLDPVAYNVLLTMYLKGNLLHKAEEVLETIMKEENLRPDSYLFLCMLKVCIKAGLMKRSVDIYWRIVGADIVWTESMYTGVIHCCGRALPIEELLKVFEEMIEAKIPMNNVTCNVLIDIFGKAGMLDKAHFVLRLAQQQGVQDCISFSTMIDAYGKCKEFDKMEALFVEMRNRGFQGCRDAYNSMLDTYGMSGQIDKMENTFSRMRMVGCIPNLTTYNTLLKIYGQEGMIEDVADVLKKLEQEKDLKWDSYTYNTLIYAYGNAEMLDEAMKLFMEMQKEGFVPDVITYNCLVSALKKAGQNKQAARLLMWMEEGEVSL